MRHQKITDKDCLLLTLNPFGVELIVTRHQF